MSTQIFLGSPPPHIEAWIKANFKPKAKWVPAAYTNEWAFSDGNTNYIIITGPNGYDFSTITEDEYNYLMQYTDGMTIFHIESTDIPYENTIIGFSSYAEMKKTTELTFKPIDSSNPDLKCYRIYTPGHWEDANGNWINGSWGKWNNEEYSSVSWLSYDDAKTQHESGWFPEVNDISKLFGWQYGSVSLNNLNVKDA